MLISPAGDFDLEFVDGRTLYNSNTTVHGDSDHHIDHFAAAVLTEAPEPSALALVGGVLVLLGTPRRGSGHHKAG